MSLMPLVPSIIANLLRKPSTRPYPLAPRPPFERTRGSIAIIIEDCIYCGLCMRKCPTKALETSRPETYWQINRLRCIQCGACVEVCPKKCLLMKTDQPHSSQGAQIERFEVQRSEKTDA